MDRKMLTKTRQAALSILFFCVICVAVSGCLSDKGYSNESLYSDEVCSVYVEMFENSTFRRGIEYELTDALAKRIESQTPYKIISDRDAADTLMTGQLVSMGQSVANLDKKTGRALEKKVELTAIVSWKNLKTGELILDRMRVVGSADYSVWQNQSVEYAATVAANTLAERIVELMEVEW